MQVIFLDIDGVLNIYSPSYHSAMLQSDGSTKWMEFHLIQRLHYLLEKTGAEIVISSSWRGDMDDLKKQLEKNGFKYWNRVQGRTGFANKHRGQQILDYLGDHKEITGYVILEDEPQDICGEKCNIIDEAFVVQVDMQVGLSHKDIILAKNILYKQEKQCLV